MSFEEQQFKQTSLNKAYLPELLEKLALEGWATTDKLFPIETNLNLALECQKIALQGQMTKASIGRGDDKQIQKDIRGDNIFWLDHHPFLENLEVLRQSLNEYFYLGLKRFEAHFAFYPGGTGYDKHLDNYRGLNHRKITFVLYLNENWQKSDGGELAIYKPESENEILAKVEPRLGNLILFRSEDFPHEVETSNTNRLSLTGWFRDDIL